MAYQGGVTHPHNASFRSDRDQRTIPPSYGGSAPPGLPRDGGGAGSFRDTRPHGPYMNQGNLQDPNTSFGSQGRFSDVQDPNTSRSSIRKGPSVPARVDSRHGSLRRQQDYNSGGVAVPSGIFVSNQGQGFNYQQQFENPEYYQIGQNQPSSRPGSTRSSAAYTSQQPPEYYQLQTSPKHSPRDSGYQPTPTGTLQKKDSHRMSSQRDYDGVIKRQRSFQEAQDRPTSRAGSVQSAGAGTHRSTGSSIYGLLAEGE